MDAREQRGLEIAARARIEKQGNSWLVPSQSGQGTYSVTMGKNGNPHCDCPDYDLRGQCCKHGFAVLVIVKRETVTVTTAEGEQTTVTETAAVRLTYSQNWPAYNQAQTQEKELFCRLLRDLCGAVPEPVQERGRPRIPLPDALFSACYKVYSGMSGRRFMTDMREAHAAGFVERAWSFNPILRVIADPNLTATLYDLVTASAAPLASVESTFAVDSTGFGTVRYYRHFAHKWGKEIESRDWIKLHALIGTKTNVIAVAKVTERNGADSPQFEPLVLEGADHFRIANVVADKAYGSRKNVALTASLGANPYIALINRAQSSAQRKAGDRRDSMAWRWLWHLYNMNRETFLQRYHARSNAESTFSAMKRVFGDTLRAKGFAAQVNELLLKVIAYNVVCQIHSLFELGVELPSLHLNGSGCTQMTASTTV